MPKNQPPRATERTASRGRHATHCKICSHAEREQIEQDFVNWASASRIATRYSVSANGLYRHAHALDLMEKRRRNVRAALEKIIEQAGEVEVNAAAVVQAVGAYARINARGELVERRETIDLNQLFNRMSTEELESYANSGTLPPWFEATVGATTPDSQESDEEVQVIAKEQKAGATTRNRD